METSNTTVARFSRPGLLILAILQYKWGGRIASESGKCRTLLYETLYSLYPDAFGRRKGTRPAKIEKDSVLRNLYKAGLITMHTSAAATWAISVTGRGANHLVQGHNDPRYHDDLHLTRDYYHGSEIGDKVVLPLGKKVATKESPKAQKLIDVLTEDEDLRTEIAVSPGWDTEPVEEQVGWALRDVAGAWHLTDPDGLSQAISKVTNVQAIYPLKVTH